jgi:perosamine synthetase
MADDIPYARQWLDEDDVEAVARALRGDFLTTGPLVEAFERELATRAETAHAVAVSSGTAALHSAYFALGLGPGSALVTSPLTFVATASAAALLGADVRFADVEASTGNLDPEAAGAALDAPVRAVAAVDFAGHPARYEQLREICEAGGAALVADAAHSFGARRGGCAATALADVAITSFHPVKLITTAEGGALLTSRADLAQRARRFRNHGIVREPEQFLALESPGPWHYEVHELGLNYRLPDVLCALGLAQLAKLSRFVARRREIAARYQAELASLASLELPVVEPACEPSWHLYVVRVREAKRRRDFFEALRARGLGVQLHYAPVHLQPAFRARGFRAGQFPRAEDFAARALSLPLFPRMSDANVSRVIETVHAAARALL